MEYLVVYAIVGVIAYVAVTTISVALGMLLCDRIKRRRESGPRRFYE